MEFHPAADRRSAKGERLLKRTDLVESSDLRSMGAWAMMHQLRTIVSANTIWSDSLKAKSSHRVYSRRASRRNPDR